MSAKEMFEKLGFYVHGECKDVIWYKEKKGEFLRNVRFNNEFKIIDLWLINRLGERVDINISIELLQAINKQVEELGWNEEESKQFCDDVWEELPDILSALEGSDKE